MFFTELSRPHRQKLGFCVPEAACLLVLMEDGSASPPKSWLLQKNISYPSLIADDIPAPSDLLAVGIEYLMIPPANPRDDGIRDRIRQRLQRDCTLVANLSVYGEIYFIGSVQLSRPTVSRRVVAILAAYNEARFIDSCLHNLISQDVDVYLLDNGSTDQTVRIAEKWLGKGLINIEHLPRNGTFQLRTQLKRKQALTGGLEADWFIHVDADEILKPPPGDWNLASAITAVEEAGYNAINFQEYTFIPTMESPDHDNANYLETMRHYYPFAKQLPFGIRAWKNEPDPVELVQRGGHIPRFTNMRLCPVFFANKHYQFLSTSQAISKYGRTKYDPAELDTGLHGGHGGWRDRFTENNFRLPQAYELRELGQERHLDASQPWREHYLEQLAGTSHWCSNAPEAESNADY